MKKIYTLLSLLSIALIPLLAPAQCFSDHNKIKRVAEMKQVLEAAQIPLDSISNGDTLVTRYDVELKKLFKMVHYQGTVAMIKQNDALAFYYMGTQRISTGGVLSRVNTYDDCGSPMVERVYNAQGVLILETTYKDTIVDNQPCRLSIVTGGMESIKYTENYLEMVNENRQLKHGWFKTWKGEKLVEEIEYDMGRKIAHNKY